MSDLRGGLALAQVSTSSVDTFCGALVLHTYIAVTWALTHGSRTLSTGRSDLPSPAYHPENMADNPFYSDGLKSTVSANTNIAPYNDPLGIPADHQDSFVVSSAFCKFITDYIGDI